MANQAGAGGAGARGGGHASNEALAKLKERLRKVDAALGSLSGGGGGGGGIGGSGSVPQVVIPRNPSPFGVFAAVRLTCLSNKQRRATILQLETAAAWKEAEEIGAGAAGGSGGGGSDLFDTSSSDEALSTKGVPIASLPKIVGIGLQGVFEIIRESRLAYPNVCKRALTSLLNILQGTESLLKVHTADFFLRTVSSK